MTANMATTNTDDVQRDHAARDWLLSSDEPTLRERTRRELLLDAGNDASDHDAAAGPKETALFEGLGPDGAPGSGWCGPQWRLLALLDLGASPDDPRFQAAASYVVDQALRRPQHRGHPTVINGLHRLCANVEEIALTVGCSGRTRRP